MRNTRAQFRRGSAYLLVVGASLMVTIIGLSVVTLAQINGRLTNQENDSTECEILAQAALEYAAVKINGDAAWRTTYSGIFTPTAVALGRGTITFKITDTSGNAISTTNTAQPVKVWGIARIGTTCRVFSCTFTSQTKALAVLKTAVHSGSGVSISNNMTTTNGPVSSNSTMSINANVTGDVQAMTISNSGSVSGKTTTLTAPLTMPPATIYNTYYQYGTDLPYAFTGGAIQNCVLSSASNPFGPVNPYGVYRINVPAGQSLTISGARCVATLVINLGTASTVTIGGQVLIQPPRSDFPSLVINTGASSTVSFSMGNNTLQEGSSGVPNLNPPGTPYNGVSNSTTSDSYPSQVMGLVHVIGSGSVNFSSNATFVGPLICDAPLSLPNHGSFQGDSNLAKYPPMGFTQSNGWGPVAGTYRREMDN
jgi:hypothetical protein